MGSRTIKVLAALLVAMTFGAFALAIMDRAPIRPAAHLAAWARSGQSLAAVIERTDTPISPIRWRNVVLHSTGSAGADMAQRCHFTIDHEGRVQATELWQSQADGQHTYVRGYNADSVGVCLIGNLDEDPPPRAQFDALAALVNALQRRFGIYPQQIYLHCELDANSISPGPAFPTAAFASRLLAPR